MNGWKDRDFARNDNTDLVWKDRGQRINHLKTQTALFKDPVRTAL